MKLARRNWRSWGATALAVSLPFAVLKAIEHFSPTTALVVGGVAFAILLVWLIPIRRTK